MHPVIRVFSAIVAIVFLATPAWGEVLLVLVISMGLLMSKDKALLLPALKMLGRLKWLYLSIFIVYGWFTPGQSVPALPMLNASYLPTIEGLQAGALRVSVLIAIVSVVAGLLQTMEKDKLVAAIVWLTLPLRKVGLDSQRFALLLVLTLDRVLQSETTVRELLQEKKQQTGLLNKASAVIAGALLRVENSASQEQMVEINLDETSSPSPWQWLIPLVLGTTLYLLRY